MPSVLEVGNLEAGRSELIPSASLISQRNVNLGGVSTTASGVVFIGAALDRRLHAYDIETGRELWQGELPAGAKATAMTYRLASGAEYVAVAAGGGGAWGTGDYVVTFRLPSQ
jgi:quinoprotein glucose dehydrogenase